MYINPIYFYATTMHRDT